MARLLTSAALRRLNPVCDYLYFLKHAFGNSTHSSRASFTHRLCPELDSKMDSLAIGSNSAAASASAASGTAPKVSKFAGVLGTVTITKHTRTKKKSVTVVTGLEDFGVKLKDLAKLLGKRFACGCAVVETEQGAEEIAIQGDFQHELADYIAEKVTDVPKGRIFFVEKLKKFRAFPDAAADDEASVQTLVSDAQAIIDDL